METLFFHRVPKVKNENDTSLDTIKQATPFELYQFGLKTNYQDFVPTLEELRKNPPNIVIAEAVRNGSYVQEGFRIQHIFKGSKYVMSLGVYEQLHYFRNFRVLKPAKVKFKNVFKPYIGQDLDGKTLLVSRTGGIGDLLFIQPSLRYLKEKYPSCKIFFSCGPQYQDMVKEWDCVDKVYDLPFSYTLLFEVNYHAFFEGVIERCLEAQSVNSYILFSRWLGLDIETEKLVPKQEPNKEKLETCKKILLEKFGLEPKSFITIQMRASSPVRTPRPEIWSSLISELVKRGHKVVLVDSEKKSKIVDDFISFFKLTDSVYNFAPYSKDVGFLVALASCSKLCLSCDTALLHVAESVGTKSFGIYGAFPGRVRVSTYKKCQWIQCVLGCSPCFIHGQEPCYNSRDGYGKCYDELDISYTVDCIEEHMSVE